MNKKTFMAWVFSLLVIATLLVGLGNADPFIPLPPPQITISSPENNKMYTMNNISLVFTLDVPSKAAFSAGQYATAKGIKPSTYLVDDQFRGYYDGSSELSKTYVFSLPRFSDGWHTVKIWATAIWNPDFGGADTLKYVSFFIDTVFPSISVLSANGSKYGTADVSLNFTITEPVSMIYYSLDGRSNATLAGNFAITHIYGKDNYCVTFHALEEGAHSLQIYANDTAGNIGKSDTIFFTVNTSTPDPSPSPSASSSPSPFPSATLKPSIEPAQTATPTKDDNQTLDLTPILALSGIAVIAVAVGALVIFRRRR